MMNHGTENRGFFPSTCIHNTNNHKNDDVSCANLKTLAYVASMVQAEQEKQQQKQHRKPKQRLLENNMNSNSSDEVDANNDCKYWLRDDWVPVHDGTGERKSAHRIRDELLEYMQAHQLTKAQMLQRLGVHVNSFNNFMKTYKQPWRAFGNATYWAAARLLEAERHKSLTVPTGAIITPAFIDRRLHDNNVTCAGSNVVASMSMMKQNGVFRNNDHSTENKNVQMSDKMITIKHEDDTDKENSNPEETVSNMWCHKQHKIDATEWMERISNFQTDLVSEYRVYDSCREIIAKIHDFLAIPGVTKAHFCRALGCVNSNSLQSFLRSNGQAQRGNCTYRRAWVFFEKKRILEGARKTAARLRNERVYPYGFPLKVYGSKPLNERKK